MREKVLPRTRETRVITANVVQSRFQIEENSVSQISENLNRQIRIGFFRAKISNYAGA